MNYGGHFEPDQCKAEMKALEAKTLDPDFWNDQKMSSTVMNTLNSLRNKLSEVETLKTKLEDNLVLLDDDIDEEFIALLEAEYKELEPRITALEIKLLLSGEFDRHGAVLEIHAGAGGTEACDWANMLYRMYLRWCEKHHYQVEVVEEQRGDEVGIKSLTMLVRGEYAYGYLKCEKGVHRLVRISPFDSGARRHTSFASVLITPLFDQAETNIEIKDSDLKIDVYRSSGAGGQHVNTTDSAVRITHLPTKTVVTCQNERSQIRTREKALELLKIKLYQLEVEQRNAALKKIQGTQMEINFGSQIRSYVMHPYSMVKDHRTNTENANVDKVMDGELDCFINDNLKRSC